VVRPVAVDVWVCLKRAKYSGSESSRSGIDTAAED